MNKPLEIRKILRDTADTYKNCLSYQDSGRMKAIIRPHTDKALIKDIRFKTFFQRPYLFRFEWTEASKHSQQQRNFIWSDGEYANSCYSWDDDENEEDYEDEEDFQNGETSLEVEISSVVAEATGVSHGLAHNISAMLMPFIGGKLICNESFLILNEETVDATLWKLMTSESGRETTKIWISRKSQTIFRIEEEGWVVPIENPYIPENIDEETKKMLLEDFADSEPFQTYEETIYESVILNELIPASVFDSETFIP